MTIKHLFLVIAWSGLLAACGGGGDGNAGDAGNPGGVGANPTPPPSAGTIADPTGGGEYGSGPWPARVASTAPTSYMLIDAAVSAGTLDAQTGIVYKVYSDYGDARLPAPYQGDDRSIVEGQGLDEAKAFHARVGLSQAAQDLLAPFFTPAFQAGSWWHVAHPGATVASAMPTTWTGWLQRLASMVITPAMAAAPTPCEPRAGFVCPTLTDWKAVKGVHAAVWYLVANEATDLPKATTLLQEIEADVWPKLTQRMGITPPVGGDGLYNFILMDLPKGGVNGNQAREGNTASGGFLCSSTAPSWSYLNRSMVEPKLRGQATHEFMHALIYAKPLAGSLKCPVASYPMLLEASAVWATHYVYPRDNVEQPYAKHYLARADAPYEHDPSDDLFRYGGYLFPMFLHMQLGAQMIPAIWDAAATADTEYKAMEAALNGRGSSLRKIWPKFAVALLNKKSSKSTAKDSFALFDPPAGASPGLVDSVQLFDDTGAKATAGQAYPMAANGEVLIVNAIPTLPHLASGHSHYLFNDPNIRSVLSTNGLTFRSGTADPGFGPQFAVKGMSQAVREGRSIRVLLKMNGDWNAEATTLDNLPWITACRGDPAGKIEEMIVIYANGEFDPARSNYNGMATPANPSATLLSNMACMAWTLNLDMTGTRSGIQETLKVTNMVMKSALPTEAPKPGEPPVAYPFADTVSELMIPYGWVMNIESGAVAWNYLEAGTDCTTRGSLSASLQATGFPGLTVDAHVSQTINAAAARGLTMVIPAQLGVSAQGTPFKLVTTCKSGGTAIVQDPAGTTLELAITPDGGFKLDANGISASGTAAQTAAGATDARGSWALTGQ
jgi:hypothetical protein